MNCSKSYNSQWQIYEENSRFLGHNSEALHCATSRTHWKKPLARTEGSVALILLRIGVLLQQTLQDQEEALTIRKTKVFTNLILLLIKKP